MIWHGLRDSFLMAWEVWWALVFGFAISAIVQAWVPRERIEARSAARGARLDRLGDRARRRLVLLLLRGDRDRQVAVPEGGERRGGARVPVRVDEPRLGAGARAVGADRLAVHARRIRRRDRDDRADDGPAAAVRQPPARGAGARARARGRHRPPAPRGRRAAVLARAADLARAWSDVAHNFRGDWQMLWREITIGFLLAGFIAQLGNGFFEHCSSATRRSRCRRSRTCSSARSSPCSASSARSATSRSPRCCGRAGSRFGGVLAFLFADLIVLPILAIYRKYYGTRFTVRITALMFVTMAIAALVVDGIFSALGLIPTGPRPTRADIFSSIAGRLQARAERPRRRDLRRLFVAHRPPRRDRPGVRDEGRPREGGRQSSAARPTTSARSTACTRSKPTVTAGCVGPHPRARARHPRPPLSRSERPDSRPSPARLPAAVRRARDASAAGAGLGGRPRRAGDAEHAHRLQPERRASRDRRSSERRGPTARARDRGGSRSCGGG